MKILILHLKNKWFRKISSGEKTKEYRWYNDYWISRVIKKEMHTHIKFINGYGKNAPYLLFELIRVDIINDETDLGNGKQFVFNLGKLISKGNLSNY